MGTTGSTAPLQIDGPFAVRVDDVGSGTVYVGEAEPGSAEAAPVWRIKKIVDSGSPTDTAVTWADGDREFDNVWSDRLSLSYS